MKTWIEITQDTIETDPLLQFVHNPNAGANLLFLGTTRQITGDLKTVALRYESYQPMAEKKLRELADEAQTRWPLLAVAIVHRMGTVAPGETSMAVSISSPHRAEAFEAGSWLIDRIKQVVPVWKQEVAPHGDTRWVHPAGESPS